MEWTWLEQGRLARLTRIRRLGPFQKRSVCQQILFLTIFAQLLFHPFFFISRFFTFKNIQTGAHSSHLAVVMITKCKIVKKKNIVWGDIFVVIVSKWLGGRRYRHFFPKFLISFLQQQQPKKKINENKWRGTLSFVTCRWTSPSLFGRLGTLKVCYCCLPFQKQQQSFLLFLKIKNNKKKTDVLKLVWADVLQFLSSFQEFKKKVHEKILKNRVHNQLPHTQPKTPDAKVKFNDMS